MVLDRNGVVCLLLDTRQRARARSAHAYEGKGKNMNEQQLREQIAQELETLMCNCSNAECGEKYVLINAIDLVKKGAN